MAEEQKETAIHNNFHSSSTFATTERTKPVFSCHLPFAIQDAGADEIER